MKRLPRQGWVDRGIPNPESVAEHTFRMALMAWVLGQAAGLDSARLIKLVLVHDLPEAVVGDATPYQGLLARGLELSEALARWRELLSTDELAEARRQKEALETEALADLAAPLAPPLREELVELWTEYTEQRTPEARFVAQLDRLEALLQAIEYQEAGCPSGVQSFLRSAREEVQHPVLRALLHALEDA